MPKPALTKEGHLNAILMKRLIEFHFAIRWTLMILMMKRKFIFDCNIMLRTSNSKNYRPTAQNKSSFLWKCQTKTRTLMTNSN